MGPFPEIQENLRANVTAPQLQIIHRSKSTEPHWLWGKGAKRNS